MNAALWKASAKAWRSEAGEAQHRERVALSDCHMWREQFAVCFDELQRIAPNTNFAKLLFDARERQKHYNEAGEFVPPVVSVPADTRGKAAQKPEQPSLF